MSESNDNTGRAASPRSADSAAPDGELPVAFEQLLPVVRAHWRSLWRLLRRLGVHVSALDDATAQVFLLYADEVDGAPEEDAHVDQVRQSLRRIALRLAGDSPSSAGPEGLRGFGSLSSLPPPSMSLADAMVERRGLRQLLDRILERMPFDVRAPFVLFELERLELSEAADLLDAPFAETSTRHARACELFRAGLAGVGAADPSVDSTLSQEDSEAADFSPFERNVLRSADLDEAPDELQDGIETAVKLGLSAEEQATLDEQYDDRVAALFGQAPSYDQPEPIRGEDEPDAPARATPPLRERTKRVAAAALAALLALVVVVILADRSCSSSPSPVANAHETQRAAAPSLPPSPPTAASTGGVLTQVEPEMRLEAPDREPVARSGPSSQRPDVPQGVLPAPGDPSYQWWIARFPLLEDDWKLLRGGDSASGREPELHSASPGNEGLKDEASRLDTVRMQLESFGATQALQSLDAYRDRWPHGAMSLDAMVLRVRALLALGRLAEADKQTQVLEGYAPNSEYARSARSFVNAYVRRK
jgi:RNA polymerase sigma-70 factor (ECF subfamily)